MPSTCRSIASIDWAASAVVAQPILSIIYLLPDWPCCLLSIAGKIPNAHRASHRVFKIRLTACKCWLQWWQSAHVRSVQVQIQSRSPQVYISHASQISLCVATCPCTTPCNHLQSEATVMIALSFNTRFSSKTQRGGEKNITYSFS